MMEVINRPALSSALHQSLKLRALIL